MKKQDKEIKIIELRLKEIESIDRDTTNLWFKVYAVLGAIFLFLYANGFLKIVIVNVYLSLICVIIFIFGLLWLNWQSIKSIEDYYDGLFFAIKEDKILDFKISTMYNPFFYKRKYK
jgi:hypothetical protein